MPARSSCCGPPTRAAAPAAPRARHQPASNTLKPLDAELAATAANVVTARHAVADYCADQALDHDGVALAVTEAVTNAVMHAYRDREPGTVRIFASVGDGALVVIVSDDGPGMTPRTDSPGIGLGLFPDRATLNHR